MRRSKWLFILLIVLMGFCLVACGDDDEDDSSDRKKTKEPTETVTDVPSSPTDSITGYPAQNPDYDGPGSDGDVTATPTVEPTAEPTEVVEPTTEVTPEPTPEVNKDYDPEVVFDSNKDEYTGNMFKLLPEYFDNAKVAYIYEKEGNKDINKMRNYDTWKAFCENNNLYYDITNGIIKYPIPLQEKTIYLNAPVNTNYNFNFNFPSVCVVFVKDGEEFNLNDLLAKARLEKGEDYTLNEMIASEYGNIITWSGIDASQMHMFDTEYTVFDNHKINIKDIFPEEGLYTAYVYRYYAEDEEWHRVNNETVNCIKYNACNYEDIGLVLELR